MKTKTTARPKQEMDLMKLIAQFDTDDKCRAALEQLRWPDGVCCIRCASDKISRDQKLVDYHTLDKTSKPHSL